MSEEEQLQQRSAQTAPAAAPTEQGPALPNQKKTHNVVFYLVVMFSVALCLILLSFLMQQRNHEALLKGISSSNSSVQALVDLESERGALQDELASVQSELSAAQTEIAALKTQLAEANTALEAAQAASKP